MLLLSNHFLRLSQNGMTAIHVAALFGQTEIVQEFLSRAPKSAMLTSEVRKHFTREPASERFHVFCACKCF